MLGSWHALTTPTVANLLLEPRFSKADEASTALADKLGIQTHSLRDMTCSTAASVVLAEKAAYESLLRIVSQLVDTNILEHVMLFEHVAWDESPMKTKEARRCHYRTS